MSGSENSGVLPENSGVLPIDNSSCFKPVTYLSLEVFFSVPKKMDKLMVSYFLFTIS